LAWFLLVNSWHDSCLVAFHSNIVLYIDEAPMY
jgi:hypothetical protein